MIRQHLFSLPENWTWTRFGAIATIVNGRAYSQPELLSSGTPVLRIQNLNGGDRWYYSDLDLPDDKYCDKDDLLFAWSATFGPYWWSGPRCIYHYHIWKVLVGNSLDKRYAFHVLAWLTDIVKEGAHGITMVHMTKAGMEDCMIPLPPLPEQKRIAAILDKADAIRRKHQQAIELTENLLRSAFLEMFGDPVTNPKGWPIEKLAVAIDETQYGTAAKADSARIGLPILRMNNITYAGGWDLTSLKWCRIAHNDLDKYTTRRGDLLFNRTNSPELVGKTAVWNSDDVYAIAGYLVRVRFNRLADAHYVSALLNSAYGKRLLFAKAKPSNNMSNLSASELTRLEVPLPPRSEQDRFAALTIGVQRSGPTRAAAWRCAEELSATLTQRAFSGRL